MDNQMDGVFSTTKGCRLAPPQLKDIEKQFGIGDESNSSKMCQVAHGVCSCQEQDYKVNIQTEKYYSLEGLSLS